MPVYQYACTECGDELEERQSFTDAPLTVCPSCGGRLRKVLSPVGVVFKGSGFYRTDSRTAAANGTSAKADAGSKKSDSAAGGSGSKESSGASSTGSGSTGSSGSGSSTSGSGTSGSSGSGSKSDSGGKSGDTKRPAASAH